MDNHELEIRLIDTAIDHEASHRLGLATRAHSLWARSIELRNIVIGSGMTPSEEFQARSLGPAGFLHPAVIRELGNAGISFSATRKSKKASRIMRELEE